MGIAYVTPLEKAATYATGCLGPSQELGSSEVMTAQQSCKQISAILPDDEAPLHALVHGLKEENRFSLLTIIPVVGLVRLVSAALVDVFVLPRQL